MARKNVTYGYDLLTGLNTVSATTNSNSTDTSQMDTASIDLQWSSSTLVATVTVQVANGPANPATNTSNPPNWRTLDFGTPIMISGASGRHDIIFTEMPFTILRITITPSSGTGTVTAVITQKSSGA